VSHAITVHKSQSITVNKMVTDLSERDFQTGLSYVAVWRVKMLEGLMIDAPFERASLYYDKLPDGVLMKVRDQDWRRQQQLDQPLFHPLFS
jgi:ATP-dependent DNA helicase PIF1